MSSTNGEIRRDDVDRTINIIKRARLANAEALARLAAVFESNRSSEQELWFWKHPLPEPTKPLHFINGLKLKNGDAFWAEILRNAVHIVKKTEFIGIPVLWAGFAIDETSSASNSNLGLDYSIVYYTSGREPTASFPHSFNKRYLDRILRLRAANGSRSPWWDSPDKGFGLCVTKEQISAKFGQLSFIHVGGSSTQKFRGDQLERWEHPVLKQVRNNVVGTQANTDLWHAYITPYSNFVGFRRQIGCHLSATSVFHSISDPGAKAAAQLVVGLGKAPDRTQALLIYNSFQIMLAGLPALFSSMQRLKYETAVLKTYSQRARLLERPLASLTGALAAMQADTQALRAILYEPSRALFSSHKALSDLFDEDRALKASDHVTVFLNHGNNYRDDTRNDSDLNPPERRKGTVGDGRVVLAVALMRILGKEDALKDRRSRSLIEQEAIDTLERTEFDPTFQWLVGDIRWLLGLPQKDQVRNLFRKPSLSLSALKRVLFDPFKLETREWDMRALLLATRPYQHPQIPNPGTALVNFDPGISPVPYHAVLSFATELAAAIYHSPESKGAAIDTVRLEKERARIVCRISFNTKRIVSARGLQSLTDLINHFILKQPSDWRTTDADAGNFRKPFVDLANRLLGLTKPRTHARSGDSRLDENHQGGWCAFPIVTLARSSERWEIFGVQHNQSGRMFRVGFSGFHNNLQTVFLEWSPAPKRIR